jgi:hypothetical protein
MDFEMYMQPFFHGTFMAPKGGKTSDLQASQEWPL